jgi:membrane protease YdiL (CAAX protease family)
VTVDARPLSVLQALLLVLFAAVGLVTLGGIFARYGPVGVTATEVTFIGLPVVLAASRRGGLPGIGLVRPRLRHVLGGALVGAAGWAVLATLVIPIQERFFATPDDVTQTLRDAVAPNIAALVAISVVPAVCEELLLRGALAFALARSYGRVLAVLGSACVFALLHASPYRFVPTFLLGLSFGAIALRTGSLLPTMVAHALNNGAIWLLTTVPALAQPLDAHALPVGIVAAVVVGAGHRLVFLRFPSSP